MADENAGPGPTPPADSEGEAAPGHPSGPGRPGVAAHQRRVSELAAEERRDAERRAEREAERTKPSGDA